jgi:hypothetical protein
MIEDDGTHEEVHVMRAGSSPTDHATDSQTSMTAHDEHGATETPNWLHKNLWPLLATVAIIAVGMAYTLSWAQLYYHVHVWLTPGDIWSTFRDAHFVGWGSEGAIYAAGTSLVTFPGIAVLLTPIAMLQNPLHLSSSIPFYLLKPTEWLVLGPVDLVLGGVFLFPLNKFATRLSISARRRVVLVWFEAILVWAVVVLYGHPEDTIAMALAVYALIAVLDESWLHAGFFFGLAVAFQPLTLLILPIALVRIPWRKWPMLAGEIILPSAILLVGPLVNEWGPTTRALLKQPNFPTLNHPTPWLALAPRLSPARYVLTPEILEHTLPDGKRVAVAGLKRVLSGEVVSAGPGREVALALVVVIGVVLYRHKPSWPRLVWWIAVALSMRCVFESILDPFYFFPGLAIAVLAAFTTKSWKMSLTMLFASVCTVVSFWHLGDWTYYLLVNGSLLLTLLFAYPTEGSLRLVDDADEVRRGASNNQLI